MPRGLSTWALLVSRTRSAWLGAVAGLVLVAVLRAPKLLWLVGAGVLVVLVARPGAVADRLTVTDASSVDRYYMWQAGLDMILEQPVFGQGPGMIVEIYPSYRWPQAPNPRAPHLHDNALQIAAERGLPCLVWWLWWVVRALADSLREFRRLRSEGQRLAVAGGGVPGRAVRAARGRPVRVQLRRLGSGHVHADEPVARLRAAALARCGRDPLARPPDDRASPGSRPPHPAVTLRSPAGRATKGLAVQVLDRQMLRPMARRWASA